MGNTFEILEAVLEGMPLVAMIDTRVKGCSSRDLSPWCLAISTRYPASASGFPESEELLALDSWEDELAGHLGETALFAGRITWNGQRELIFYLQELGGSVAFLESLAGTYNSRSFSYMADFDPTWALIEAYWSSEIETRLA